MLPRFSLAAVRVSQTARICAGFSGLSRARGAGKAARGFRFSGQARVARFRDPDEFLRWSLPRGI